VHARQVGLISPGGSFPELRRQPAGFRGRMFQLGGEGQALNRLATDVAEFHHRAARLGPSCRPPAVLLLFGELGEGAIVGNAILIGRHRHLARKGPVGLHEKDRVDSDDRCEEGHHHGQNMPSGQTACGGCG